MLKLSLNTHFILQNYKKITFLILSNYCSNKPLSNPPGPLYSNRIQTAAIESRPAHGNLKHHLSGLSAPPKNPPTYTCYTTISKHRFSPTTPTQPHPRPAKTPPIINRSPHPTSYKFKWQSVAHHPPRHPFIRDSPRAPYITPRPLSGPIRPRGPIPRVNFDAPAAPGKNQSRATRMSRPRGRGEV